MDKSDKIDEKATTVHFCFLVLGYKEYSTSGRKDYLMKSMVDAVSKFSPNNNVIYHTLSSNDYKTHDGVANGGQRVANDTIRIVQDKLDESPTIRKITISFLGISLGGLYSRYAIAKIYEKLSSTQKMDNDTTQRQMMLKNGRGENVSVHFNTFYSCASPHLGLKRNTYIPLPRWGEYVIAKLLKKSGCDMFQFNDLLWEMATSSNFLEPLSLFQNRVAYANAYHTDFLVNTRTSGILHEDSTFPHRITHGSHIELEGKGTINYTEPKSELSDKEKKFIVAIAVTEKSQDASVGDKTHDCKDCDNQLSHMSKCLDELGWKKIFVDVRNEIPIHVNLSSLYKVYQIVTGQKLGETMDLVKSRKYRVGSRDLDVAFSLPKNLSFSWPIGHFIISSSNFPLMNTWSQRGEPVVESMIKSTVTDICSWSEDLQLH